MLLAMAGSSTACLLVLAGRSACVRGLGVNNANNSKRLRASPSNMHLALLFALDQNTTQQRALRPAFPSTYYTPLHHSQYYCHSLALWVSFQVLLLLPFFLP